MKPHKHADLIKAWADGAEIQHLEISGRWYDSETPEWLNHGVYRIKPEPKPDFVGYVHASKSLTWGPASAFPFATANIKVIFDGKTGKPKSAEVLE